MCQLVNKAFDQVSFRNKKKIFKKSVGNFVYLNRIDLSRVSSYFLKLFHNFEIVSIRGMSLQDRFVLITPNAT